MTNIDDASGGAALGLATAGKSTAIKGYLGGLRHKALLRPLIVVSAANPFTGPELASLHERLRSLLETRNPASIWPALSGGIRACRAPSPLMLVSVLLQWTQSIQRAAGLPVFEAGVALGKSEASGARINALIAVYAQQYQAAAIAFAAAFDVLQTLWSGDSAETALTRLGPIIDKLRRFQPKGSNTAPLLQAAFDAGIPYTSLAGTVFQYGYGHRSRWLDSTLSDETPALSTGLARNKAFAAQVLRQAGIPVPAHALVDSADKAVALAAKIGYPVVVKPADKDGGEGVAAGLANAEEVRAAFAVARKASPQVLLEKHVAGRDYRLTVFHGATLWAIERIPGGVTGDGQHSVAELLKELNRNPRRGTGPGAPLKRIALDDEACALLAGVGLTPDSIPAPGEFIRLRRTANVATGGMPVAVLDRVHPDNRALAERATAALRLDLAGVDLLIPDISRSWKEGGAAICEVNAQPQLGLTTGPHLYGEILTSLVDGQGRVPIVVILGAEDCAAIAADLRRHLFTSLGWRVGSVDETRVTLHQSVLSASSMPAFEGSVALLCNKQVQAVVVCVNDSSLLSGLPFDRFDVLVIAGHHVKSGPSQQAMTPQRMLGLLLENLLPACTGTVLRLAEAGLQISGYRGFGSAHWHEEPLPRADLGRHLYELLSL
ncbi:MAG: acetate--CoA ligase family protein [Porticoccaceae bacterium]